MKCKGKALWKAKKNGTRAWARERRKDVRDLGAVNGGSRWWAEAPLGWGPFSKQHRRLRVLLRLWMADRLPYPRHRQDLWSNVAPIPPEEEEMVEEV